MKSNCRKTFRVGVSAGREVDGVMNEEQLQKILENQVRMDEQIKTLFKQMADIKTLTETVQKLAIALEKQGMALQSTDKKVTEVKADVDEIKAKPGKRWDSAVWLAISVVLTALITYALTTAGLK